MESFENLVKKSNRKNDKLEGEMSKLLQDQWSNIKRRYTETGQWPEDARKWLAGLFYEEKKKKEDVADLDFLTALPVDMLYEMVRGNTTTGLPKQLSLLSKVNKASMDALWQRAMEEGDCNFLTDEGKGCRLLGPGSPILSVCHNYCQPSISRDLDALIDRVQRFWSMRGNYHVEYPGIPESPPEMGRVEVRIDLYEKDRLVLGIIHNNYYDPHRYLVEQFDRKFRAEPYFPFFERPWESISPTQYGFIQGTPTPIDDPSSPSKTIATVGDWILRPFLQKWLTDPSHSITASVSGIPVLTGKASLCRNNEDEEPFCVPVKTWPVGQFRRTIFPDVYRSPITIPRL